MVGRRDLLQGIAAFGAMGVIGSAGATETFSISEADRWKVPKRFRRQVVRFGGDEPPGTIVIDTASKFLFLVKPSGKALRYGIGVGRTGFGWSGSAVIRRKAKWPKWTPPPEMVERDAFAAKWANGMPGGPKNPLGARALYLYQGNVDTLYRIHGTSSPASIGKAVSSGCIRMINADVADLYDRVPIGTQVRVRNKAFIAEDIPPKRRTDRPAQFGAFD